VKTQLLEYSTDTAETTTQHGLNHVYWMGGSPCSGKSSISQLLAEWFDLSIYHVDEAFSAHVQRLDPVKHPVLTKWHSLTWNERWMRPVDDLVQEAITCYQEHFTLVLEDVLALPASKPVLVEGTALLPRQIAQLAPKPYQAVWVIPTAEFQQAQYARRSWLRDILTECEEPDTAFRNWMERDARFAGWVADEVSRLDFKALIVDGKQTIEENARQIATHYGFKVW
jgi:hypothetical protein